ncbi:MAG: tyrosine-type recombinase/integrase [Myxococcota bacterium]
MENTRAAYRPTVGDFIEAMGITITAASCSVTQAHVIELRDDLGDCGLSNPSIANRLSALSSLYKFLAAKQVWAMLEAPEPAMLRVKDFRLDRDYWVLKFTTKGEKANTVATHTECQIALRKYLGASGHDGDPQAPLYTGGPLTRGSFYKLFKKYAGLAGLPANITPHSARATFFTQAYDAGLQSENIQRMVGHSSITTS